MGSIRGCDILQHTADGFDVVESKLEERMEFLELATVRYYNHSLDAAARQIPASPDKDLQVSLI